MLVVGDNLQELCVQHGLVDRLGAYDVTSITLRLHPTIIAFDTQAVIDYGKPLKPEWYTESQIPNDGMVVNKNSGVLCCSDESISMPLGYFGFVQTKGSLARLFISATCNDGQIDPGFNGRVTLEVVNSGHLKVRIPPRAEIAQLFVFRTSTNNVTGYNGRYRDSQKPTIYTPN